MLRQRCTQGGAFCFFLTLLASAALQKLTGCSPLRTENGAADKAGGPACATPLANVAGFCDSVLFCVTFAVGSLAASARWFWMMHLAVQFVLDRSKKLRSASLLRGSSKLTILKAGPCTRACLHNSTHVQKYSVQGATPASKFDLPYMHVRLRFS